MPFSYRRLPAEWEPQSAVQLTLPHEGTDWGGRLDEVLPAFQKIALEVSKRQSLLAVCADVEQARQWLAHCPQDNVHYSAIPSNDTWARDHGALTVYEDDAAIALDFQFNGWGLKYPADKDNRINAALHEKGFFLHMETVRLVLEGGAVESDGQGTLLTTSRCLLSPNRNPTETMESLTEKLYDLFGAERTIWMEHGALEGDDTDGHIDMLARFCDAETIAYVHCQDAEDPHHDELSAMREELRDLRTTKGAPYSLVPLPMAEPMHDESGRRLPATYANFLVINEAVLMPFYGTKLDEVAKERLEGCFPGREVIGVDCKALIREGGAVHCLAMHYPEEVY